MLTFKLITTVSLFAVMLSLGSTPASAQVETNEFHSEWRDSYRELESARLIEWPRMVRSMSLCRLRPVAWS